MRLLSRRSALTAPLGVAWARLRARPGRGLLAAAGVAAATAMLAASAAGSQVAGQRAMHDALAALPADQRAVSVTWGGSLPDHATADRQARHALAELAPGSPADEALLLRQ